MKLNNTIFATALLFSLPLLGVSQTTVQADCKDTVEYYPSGQFWKKYKSCPEGVVDTMYIFRKNGELEAWFYFGSRFSKQPITKHHFLTSGACRQVEGQYILNQDHMPVNVGTWKYYWKNGALMDSVIYDSGKQIYRARFSKKNKLQFEEKEHERIGYNNDGSARFNEK